MARQKAANAAGAFRAAAEVLAAGVGDLGEVEKVAFLEDEVAIVLSTRS